MPIPEPRGVGIPVDSPDPQPIWNPVCDLRAAARLLPSESRSGKAFLAVIVKLTFNLSGSDPPQLSASPLPTAPIDEWLEGTSIIRYESDIVAFTPHADVVVVGNAYARGGSPVTELPVSLRVCTLRRGLAISGNRHVLAQLRIQA